MRDTEQLPAHVVSRGYVVVPGEVPTALREQVFEVYAAHGRPAPFAEHETRVGRCLVNPTGFVIPSLLAERVQAARWVLPDAVLEVSRAALGQDMHLEMLGANICDSSRPFFDWHQHIGGIDVEEVRASHGFPRFERSERLIAVTYLDDVDGAGGEILVVPRSIDEPTEPLSVQTAASWPGEVVVHLKAGDTLVLEQCTWHAVRPMTREGRRVFVGAYLTAAHAPPTSGNDATLDDEGLIGLVPERIAELLRARRREARG